MPRRLETRRGITYTKGCADQAPVYFSMPTQDCQHLFAQNKPLHYCRNARTNLDLCRDQVEAGRLNYIWRCRRARCSIECNRACMSKHAAIVSKMLRDYLPGGVAVYRGHLRMPIDASPVDHKRTKKEFCRIMRRWSVKHGYIFECHSVQHITDKHNCHWDTAAYSDAPKKPLRAQVSEAWSRAGGLRQSLVPLDPDEIESQCRYQAKDVAPERRRGTYHLPAPGLQFHWSTGGFWGGHKPAELWKELCKEWFPDEESSNRRDTLLEPTTTPETSPDAAVDGGADGDDLGSKSVSLLLDDSPEKTALLAEIDRRLADLPRRNSWEVYWRLPSDPDDAITAERIADDTGLPVAHVDHMLRHKLADRGAVAPARQLPGGGWQFGRWHNERGISA